MMKKEKELVPTLVKSLLSSFTNLVKDKVSKLPLYEKLKNQKKDQDGNYLFNSNDYKIVIDIHWFYHIIIKLIRQIREIFDAPLSIFNKICKNNFDFDSLFKEIFYDLVFYKEIAYLLIHAEYNNSTPSIVADIVKKIVDETRKLMIFPQIKKINDLLNFDRKSGNGYFEYITNLKKSISDPVNEKFSDLKTCIDEHETKNQNQPVYARSKKTEKEVTTILKK
jgi:hypothetical protein